MNSTNAIKNYVSLKLFLNFCSRFFRKPKILLKSFFHILYFFLDIHQILSIVSITDHIFDWYCSFSTWTISSFGLVSHFRIIDLVISVEITTGYRPVTRTDEHIWQGKTCFQNIRVLRCANIWMTICAKYCNVMEMRIINSRVAAMPRYRTRRKSFSPELHHRRSAIN